MHALTFQTSRRSMEMKKGHFKTCTLFTSARAKIPKSGPKKIRQRKLCIVPAKISSHVQHKAVTSVTGKGAMNADYSS